MDTAACTAAIATNGDLTACAVGWLCAHQGYVILAISLLGGHAVFSFISAGLKKMGISEGALVAIVRAAAVDVKPPDATVLKSADAIATKLDTPIAQVVATAVAGNPLPPVKGT